MEEKLLSKALSGMHASVSTHLSEFYQDKNAKSKKKDKFFPNVKMYFDKVGKHPDRLKNLYFAYTILLKAFKIASD